jgi:hypothetical protein
MSSQSLSEAEDGHAYTLLRLINGFQISQAIYVVVAFGVPDLLVEAPCGSDGLATRAGCDPDALYRVMRALAAAGIFTETEGRIFALTPLGDGLRSDAVASRDAWARFALGPPHWAAWGAMLHTVRTGENAFRHANGMDVWKYRAVHPADGALFDRAMRERSVGLGRALLDRYDLGRFRCIADIGGGDGSLLATVLPAYPTVTGVLLDLPHVAAGATEVLSRAGVLGRSEIVVGDFFAAVPAGADAYVLKHVLHDWDDADALIILRNCRCAMGARARLLIIERLLAPANDGLEGKLSDLNMLVNAGGRERTYEEFAALLRKAGLALTAVVPLAGSHSLLEASA